MAQYIPDNNAGYESDLDNLVQALKGNSILSGGAVSQRGAGANMSVDVTSGGLKHTGVYATLTGGNFAIAASDPTNARIDLVSTNSSGTVSVTTGTPSATPKPPALTAGNLLLAEVAVAAAASSIVNANIQARALTVANGTVQGTLAARPAATIVPAGMLYFASDEGIVYRSDASTWSAYGVTQPNLVLNSDFGRRTVFGLAMPEVFADTNGYAVISGAPTVASNILTQNAANNQVEWPKDQSRSWAWRDFRFSASFKAVATAGVYELRTRFVDSNNYVSAFMFGTGNTLFIRKKIAGVTTDSTTAAVTLTLNNWYWLEIEAQGTMFIGKIYNTGGTASGVLKSASTLVATVTFTVSDAAVAVGSTTITSDQTNTQWGGIATGNGGVYVETWLPESWSSISFSGTKGGQAVGFDESDDAGPIGKQGPLRFYIPATSREIIMDFNGDGFAPPSVYANTALRLQPSTAYAFSCYMKVSGASGNVLVASTAYSRTGAGAADTSAGTNDAGETAWTRKAATMTTGATGRFGVIRIDINSGLNRTGTGFIHLPQLEQGSATTAWRNALADDGIFTIRSKGAFSSSPSTTSAVAVDIDPRDFGINFFLPWDATVSVEFHANWSNNGLNTNRIALNIDGGDIDGSWAESVDQPVAAKTLMIHAKQTILLAAGKHRAKATWATTAGTLTLVPITNTSFLQITAYRGK